MPVEKLLSPADVAKILGVTTQTLAIWRHEKRYRLPYIKSGRLVRYEARDVEAFIASRRRGQLYSNERDRRC